MHDIPVGEVVRQGTPGAAFPGVIEQRVDDLPQVHLTRPTGSGAARGPGKQGINKDPLLIGYVAGIGFAFHTLFYANLILQQTLSPSGVSFCSTTNESVAHRVAQTLTDDHDLTRILEVWPALAIPLGCAIMTIIDASG
jgi:hypothetical protein